jgi:flagellar biogenesis protein FliO
VRQTPVILAVVLLTLVGLFATATPAARAAETDAIRRGPDSAGPTTRAAAAAALPPPSSAGATRVGLALLAIVALILTLKWGGQKFLGASLGHKPNRAVEVVARNPVGPKQSVLLLRVGRRILIVGDSAGSLSKLTEIADPDEVAELVGALRQDKSDSTPRTFGSLFKSAETDFESPAAELDNFSPPADVQDIDTSANEDRLESRDELAGLTNRVRSLSRQLGTAGA